MESGGDRVHSSVKAIQDLEAAYARFSRALVEQLPEVARELTHVTEALQDRCRNLGNEISDLKDRISSADEDDDVSWEHDRLREAEDELSSAQTRTRRLSETASAYNKQAHQITQIATHDWAEAREFLRGASDDLLAYLALQVRPESLNGSRSEPSATRVPEESDLTKSMKAQEALLAARFDTEKLVVLDANGKLLFERVGGRSHVDIYPGDEPLLKNALVTHNHPSGRSFSHADIKTNVPTDDYASLKRS
jgi:DNA repair exonuclease SbcCD ATPase subunit